MTFIKKNTNNLTVSLIFEKENKEMVDIDYIFKKTNDNFCVYLNNLSLPINFDFRNRDNKKIYMNEFIKTFTHYVKFRENKEKLYFYSNILTKDDFRNKLVLKLKTVLLFKKAWKIFYGDPLMHFINFESYIQHH
jgi:hypothetical protein